MIDVDGENITWKFKACGYEEGKKLENLPADWQLRAYAPNEQGWYTSGKVYVNVWNYDAHWGPVYYSDSGKTKVAMSKDKTHDGYANSLYEQYKDQYNRRKVPLRRRSRQPTGSATVILPV